MTHYCPTCDAFTPRPHRHWILYGLAWTSVALVVVLPALLIVLLALGILP